jgi:hypothetical protein
MTEAGRNLVPTRLEPLLTTDDVGHIFLPMIAARSDVATTNPLSSLALPAGQGSCVTPLRTS